ncbi:MAG: glycosyltransferase family 4 protein [Sporomusaceae bacterium]|nr:glycosyltransferase family 4 protein [Sporomusaceae bacterium]
MSEPPVICHLTSVHSPHDVRITVKECTSLRKKGYGVHLVHLGSPVEPINGICLHAAGPLEESRLQRMFFGVWRVFSVAVRLKAQIYHFHDPELLFVGLFLKLLGKKVVYDVHEDVPRQTLSKHWIDQRLRRLMSKTIEIIEAVAGRCFDAVVVATPYIGERFAAINRNTFVINNFPINGELAGDASLDGERRREVCYVGGISVDRGIKEMVSAAEKAQVKLILAGEFSNAAERAEVESMPGWKDVEALGFVGRQQVREILTQSIAGLVVLRPIVNYFVSQPIKMFEYMAAGIPVIASDFPLWKEIVEGHECGICVDPLDGGAVAAAIEWILDNPTEARLMGERGRRAVLDVYNWEREEEKLYSLYEGLSGKATV